MTVEEINILKKDADLAKDLLRHHLITYDEARARIMPWINEFNKVAKEKAKKFGIKAYSINFSSFIR